MASAEIAWQQQREEEIESLRCIYGHNSVNRSAGTLEVQIQLLDSAEVLKFRFTLEVLYPSPCLNGPTVTCHVSGLQSHPRCRRAAQRAVDAVLELHIAGEVLFSAISAAEAACNDELRASSESASSTATEVTTHEPAAMECRATRIHHMHDQRNYTKTLRNWADELGVSGGVFTWGRCILLVTVGRSENISDFFQRFRTSPVDVDSKGRKCKEKYVSLHFDACF